MAPDSASARDDQTVWIERKPPAPGKYTSSREPSYGDVSTNCPATDFMLSNGLPLKRPVALLYSNSSFWQSLDSREKNDYEKRHHDLARQFQEDTRKNPGSINLGNLDAEAIYAPVRAHFQSEPKRRLCGNGIGSKTDFLSFMKNIQASVPSDSGGKGILSLMKKAMGCNHGENNRENTRELPLHKDGSLNIFQEDYLTEKQALGVTAIDKNTASLDRLRYPAIAADPAAVAGTPQAVGALLGAPTWADNSPRALLGTYLNTSDVARAREAAADVAFNAAPVPGSAGAQVQRQQQHEQTKMTARRHDLTPAQEAAVHRMVPETALAVNQNIEFSADQISCINEVRPAMNNIVYRCVDENLRDQAQLRALGLNIKGDGHQLIVELNFLYRGFPTKCAVDLTKQITYFPMRFEKTNDPTNYFIAYQALCSQLINYGGCTINEAMQCSFVLNALQKTANYREFVIQFDTSDAGTIKLKDLCSRAVKYYQNTNESWGFHVTPAEHRDNKHDKSKVLRKQLNSMQDQIKHVEKQSGKWNTGKRATPGGGNLGSKKPRRTCVFCKGDHHPASCTSKLRPDGTACFGCGKPGHKSFECPDKAGGSANAITAATAKKSLAKKSFAKKSLAKKSLPISSGTCPRCHRGDHLEADCKTNACRVRLAVSAQLEYVRWYCKVILSLW